MVSMEAKGVLGNDEEVEHYSNRAVCSIQTESSSIQTESNRWVHRMAGVDEFRK